MDGGASVSALPHRHDRFSRRGLDGGPSASVVSASADSESVARTVMTTPTLTPVDCLRPQQAAARLGISVATIDRLRKAGQFVPAIKFSQSKRSSVLYRVVDIERLQKERETA